MIKEYQYDGKTFLLTEDRAQQRIKVQYAKRPARVGYVGVNHDDANENFPFGYTICANPDSVPVGPGLPEVNDRSNIPTLMLEQCCAHLIRIQEQIEEQERQEIGRQDFDPKRAQRILEDWYGDLPG